MAARAVIPATSCVRELEAALPIAAAGEDREGAHRLRVAAARLRVWLRLGGRRVLADDLRWLRKRAQAVRDLDVLLAFGGPGPFVGRLRRERKPALDALRAATASPRVQALLTALRCSPPVERERALARVARWRRALGEQGDGFDWRAAPAETLHAFRRRLRRLRYALEWIEQPCLAARAMADLLGEAQDLAVLKARAGGHAPLEAPAAREGELRHRLAPAWHQLRAELVP